MSNRPEGMPTAQAWIWFLLFASILFADAAMYNLMLLERMLK